MTSIVTNVSAIASLQTLRSITTDLTQTQNRIASGERISQASDNSAYWSISTTMRSDTKAISAVSDALSLGSAMTDTAYTGTSAIIDILTEVKAKLVAASEPGVDKGKIQNEISQLSAQAESIVDAASFSGENWLRTREPTDLRIGTTLDTSVVSSFVRNSDTSVSLNTITLDLTKTSMLNDGGGGILQKDPPRDYDELPSMSPDSYRHEGHEQHIFNGPVTLNAMDSVTFNLVVDRSPTSAGVTFPITVNKGKIDDALGTTDGVINDAIALRTVLQHVSNEAGAPVDFYRGGNADTTGYDVMSLEANGPNGSSIYFEDFTSTLAGGYVFGLDTFPGINHDNMLESSYTNFVGPFTMTNTLELSFDFQINSMSPVHVKITQDTVNDALGITTGRVETADELAAVIRHASAGQGLDVQVNGTQLLFTVDQAAYPGYGNAAAFFQISDIVSNLDWALEFDLDEIDITGSEFTMDEYIAGVEDMLGKAISSGSDLGSLKSRIDMQTDFAMDLMDTFDAGIGKLVDADMDWESTRLKALQTQQQLAVQSLSIANSNSQGLMQLFG